MIGRYTYRYCLGAERKAVATLAHLPHNIVQSIRCRFVLCAPISQSLGVFSARSAPCAAIRPHTCRFGLPNFRPSPHDDPQICMSCRLPPTQVSSESPHEKESIRPKPRRLRRLPALFLVSLSQFFSCLLVSVFPFWLFEVLAFPNPPLRLLQPCSVPLVARLVRR